MGALLDIAGARFAYSEGGRAVLDGVTLAVERGRCVCLMGVNGCGKSTLIDCVMGEHALGGGSIQVDGRAVHALSPRQRASLMSYVPQIHERTFPYTVEHVVAMGLTVKRGALIAGPEDAEDAAAVRRALRTCGIEGLAQRPCTLLSGGEMQMALLARALVQDAPLMLMDEPTAHLDFRNEVVFLETVERLVRDGGTTVLMATHSPNQAFHLAAAGVDVDVALMKDGRVHAFGAPDEVLTERALADVFGVEGMVAGLVLPDGSPMRQVVPLRPIA